jgi:hypothetical protein
MMTAPRPIVGKGGTFLPAEKQFFLAHMAETLKGRPIPKTEAR